MQGALHSVFCNRLLLRIREPPTHGTLTDSLNASFGRLVINAEAMKMELRVLSPDTSMGGGSE